MFPNSQDWFSLRAVSRDYCQMVENFFQHNRILNLKNQKKLNEEGFKGGKNLT